MSIKWYEQCKTVALQGLLLNIQLFRAFVPIFWKPKESKMEAIDHWATAVAEAARGKHQGSP